ncbi:uncharacterized protein ACWYII_045204 isoform 2-T2 [Salvelinus alpinus]
MLCRGSSYSESMEFDAESCLPGAKGGPEMELHMGLTFDLEVLQQRQVGMRQVAHLVMVLHRMKHTFQKSDSTHTPLGMVCTDEQHHHGQPVGRVCDGAGPGARGSGG